jgi:hypothetical protein
MLRVATALMHLHITYAAANTASTVAFSDKLPSFAVKGYYTCATYQKQQEVFQTVEHMF